jgi:hypothetical protein
MGHGAMESRERANLSTNAEKEHTVIVSSRIHARDVPTGVNDFASKRAIRGSRLAETVVTKRPTRLAGKV